MAYAISFKIIVRIEFGYTTVYLYQYTQNLKTLIPKPYALRGLSPKA